MLFQTWSNRCCVARVSKFFIPTLWALFCEWVVNRLKQWLRIVRWPWLLLLTQVFSISDTPMLYKSEMVRNEKSSLFVGPMIKMAGFFKKSKTWYYVTATALLKSPIKTFFETKNFSHTCWKPELKGIVREILIPGKPTVSNWILSGHFKRLCTGFPLREWKQTVSSFPNFHEIWWFKRFSLKVWRNQVWQILCVGWNLPRNPIHSLLRPHV